MEDELTRARFFDGAEFQFKAFNWISMLLALVAFLFGGLA